MFLVLVLGVGACGGSAHGGRANPRRWLDIDRSGHRATITLVAAYDSTAAGFNIDGANKGGLLFSVPSGWGVVVRCVNNASDRRYACAIVRSPGASSATPQGGGVPPRGTSQGGGVPPGLLGVPRPSEGLGAGGESAFSFIAGPPARYRLVGLTAGGEPVGMWVTLQVVRGGLPQVRWVR